MGLTGYASIWLDEDFSKLVTTPSITKMLTTFCRSYVA